MRPTPYQEIHTHVHTFTAHEMESAGKGKRNTTYLTSHHGIRHSDVWGGGGGGGVSKHSDAWGGVKHGRHLSIQTLEDLTFVDGWCF